MLIASRVRAYDESDRSVDTRPSRFSFCGYIRRRRRRRRRRRSRDDLTAAVKRDRNSPRALKGTRRSFASAIADGDRNDARRLITRPIDTRA